MWGCFSLGGVCQWLLYDNQWNVVRCYRGMKTGTCLTPYGADGCCVSGIFIYFRETVGGSERRNKTIADYRAMAHCGCCYHIGCIRIQWQILCWRLMWRQIRADTQSLTRAGEGWTAFNSSSHPYVVFFIDRDIATLWCHWFSVGQLFNHLGDINGPDYIVYIYVYTPWTFLDFWTNSSPIFLRNDPGSR